MIIEEIRRQAMLIPKEKRMETICEMDEVKELHHALKELFSRMDPQAQVEITHGRDEYGKDLVLIRDTAFGRDVTGIIVKRGHISGATRSHVDTLKQEIIELSAEEQRAFDEIVSQADMAADIEADVKTHVQTLPVTSIRVCLAGHLSKNARNRLRVQINSLVKEIWDIAWLEEKFTQFHPEIYFDSQRLLLIGSLIDKFESANKLANVISTKQLSEYFVEPIVCTVKLPGMTTGQVEQHEIDNINQLVERKKTPFSSLSKAIQTKQYVILTGDMGSGKSGAMTKIALDLCRVSHVNETSKGSNKSNGDSISLPILIGARQFLEHANDVESLIQYSFEGFEPLFSRIKISTLLIDGLDELPAEKQKPLITKARAIATLAGCSLLIGSRNVDSVNVAPEGFVKYEIMPFEVKQALTLFKSLSKNDVMLKNLKDGLAKMQFNMPATPLSLMLLAKLAEQYDEIPASITELYKQYNELALGRYDYDKGISVLFDYKVKTLFVAELAYKCFQTQDVLEIDRTVFDSFVNDYAQRHGVTTSNVEGFTWEIERAGLLKIGSKIVGFTNRTFLDYFSAFYLHEHREDFDNIEEVVTDLHFDPIWEEVAFFYVGLKSRIGIKAIQAILDRSGSDVWTNIGKLRVGRLLQAGWYAEVDAKRLGVRTAASLLPVVRQQYADYYSREGSVKVPGIISYFTMVSLAEYCFRSGFLRDVMVELVDELGQQKSVDSIRIGLPLLCVLKNLMEAKDFSTKAKPIVEAIPQIAELSATEKAAATMMLKVLYQGNTEMMKLVNRQLIRMQKRYPNSFAQLFYPKRYASSNLLKSEFSQKLNRKRSTP